MVGFYEKFNFYMENGLHELVKKYGKNEARDLFTVKGMSTDSASLKQLRERIAGYPDTAATQERTVEAGSGTYQIKTFGSEDEVNEWLRKNSHRVESVNISVHSWWDYAGMQPAYVITEYVLLYRVK
jgi:hypothetical protein